MTKTLAVRIFTPEIAHEQPRATAVHVPAHQGRLAVLPGHQPFICALRAGRLRIAGDRAQTWDVRGGGFMTTTGRDVTLVAEHATRIESP